MFHLLILTTLAVVPNVLGNLVLNSGFENNGGSGSESITSWNNGHWVARIGPPGSYYGPYMGASVISALASDPSQSDVISQTLPTSEATCYSVSFHASSGGSDNVNGGGWGVGVSFGPTIIDATPFVTSPGGEYTFVSFLLPGLGNDLLTLMAWNGFSETLIDEVTVNPVTSAVSTSGPTASCACSPGRVYNVDGSSTCTLLATGTPVRTRRAKRKISFEGVPW